MTHGWKTAVATLMSINLKPRKNSGMSSCLPQKEVRIFLRFPPKVFVLFSSHGQDLYPWNPAFWEGNCDECESQRDDLHRSIQGELVPCFFFVRWKKWRSDDHPCVGIVKFKHLFIVFYSNKVVSDPLSIYVWLVVSNIFLFSPQFD